MIHSMFLGCRQVVWGLLVGTPLPPFSSLSTLLVKITDWLECISNLGNSWSFIAGRYFCNTNLFVLCLFSLVLLTTIPFIQKAGLLIQNKRGHRIQSMKDRCLISAPQYSPHVGNTKDGIHRKVFLIIIIWRECGFPQRLENIYFEPGLKERKGQMMKLGKPLVNLPGELLAFHPNQFFFLSLWLWSDTVLTTSKEILNSYFQR